MLLRYLLSRETSNTATKGTFVVDFESTSTISQTVLLNQFVSYFPVPTTVMTTTSVTMDNDNSTANTTAAIAETTPGKDPN